MSKMAKTIELEPGLFSALTAEVGNKDLGIYIGTPQRPSPWNGCFSILEPNQSEPFGGAISESTDTMSRVPRCGSIGGISPKPLPGKQAPVGIEQTGVPLGVAPIETHVERSVHEPQPSRTKRR